MDLRFLSAALAVLASLLICTPALAADAAVPSTTPTTPIAPEALPETPEGFEVTAAGALEIAGATPEVAAQTASHGQLTTAIQVNDDGVWQVGYKDGETEVVQIKLDPHTGAVTEALTGYQVAWPMARGYEGQFGHALNAPYVWLPLALIFLVGLFDFRRPGRIAHLDLLVLLSFGISHYFFDRGEIGVSVPLAYPPLIYLLGRMMWIGWRGGEGLRPSLPVRWLGVAVIVLIAFRVTINIADSGVIDVGYAGTIGADRITHGDQLYGEGEFPDDNGFGDTYGPANYYAYVPFELAMPWDGEWDELPSSHGAAIAFDLATIAGLFAFAVRLFGRARGRPLGVLLAFAWVAYPYTDFALQSNSNDSLVAAFLVWSLALFAKPLARGALLALATMTKFAPITLFPLFATGTTSLLEQRATSNEQPLRSRLKPLLLFTLAFFVTIAVMLIEPAIHSGLGTFVDRTIVTQIDRTSPFSIWGQVGGIQWLQTALFVAAGLFAAALAFVPRRRTLPQVAALSAAVLIALQLSVDHWFYLYIPWFFGAVAIALICGASVGRTPEPAD